MIDNSGPLCNANLQTEYNAIWRATCEEGLSDVCVKGRFRSACAVCTA